MAFPILGAGSLAEGYNIENSLRFNYGDSPRLLKAGTVAGSTTFTYSAWVKYDSTAHYNFLFCDGNQVGLAKEAGALKGALYLNGATGGTYTNSDGLQRDFSAWYHLVVKCSSGTGIIYVNNVSRKGSINIPQLADGLSVGSFYREDTDPDQYNYFHEGYMADVNFIDGSALNPSSFAETDEGSGIWKPIDTKALTFGTNGFRLEFKDSSALGDDTSGEGNDFTPSGLAAIDQCTDTPTNNFATFNPPMTYTDIVSGTDTSFTFTEGNTSVSGGASSGTNWTPAVSSIGVSSGKWYYEFYNPTTDSGTEIGGAMNYDFNSNGNKDFDDAFIGIRASNGELYNISSSGSSVSNGTEWKDSGDILSVKLNMDDEEISFSTNGATYTSAVSIGGNAIYSGTLHPVVYLADNEIVTVNFGNPNWALSSGNADADGYGNFEYAVPSGYYAICTKNLAKYGG